MSPETLIRHVQREHTLGGSGSVTAARTVHEIDHSTRDHQHRHDWEDNSFRPWERDDE